MFILESAGLTDIGKKRKGNEDALFLDDNLRLYLVADGMGGRQAGEVASQLVVETISDYIARVTGGHETDELMDVDPELSKEANRLLASVSLANYGIHQLSRSKEAFRGMGSTVSAIYFAGETLIAANVGDSPIFLVHNGNIETISMPHTVRAQQAALDPQGTRRIGGEQYDHMLTRAMGIEETVEADICELQCFKGDILVVSSDGLSNKVPPEEILQVVTTEHPQKACKILVDLANERGGPDNITVIVVKVKGIKPKGRRIARFFARFFG